MKYFGCLEKNIFTNKSKEEIAEYLVKISCSNRNI